jgi:hypothetical protein
VVGRERGLKGDGRPLRILLQVTRGREFDLVKEEEFLRLVSRARFLVCGRQQPFLEAF